MKKILSVIIMCLLITTMLVACGKENTATTVAKDLDKNLNKLSVTVNKMDTIDNNYITNPDIYSSISTPSPSYTAKKHALTFKENTSSDINDIVKQLLVNRIKENMLQNNSTCDNYVCKKYCDEKGKCYYSDCDGNNYVCNGNSCSTCDVIPSTCSYVGEEDFSSCVNANKIGQTLDDIKVERLSIENEISEEVDNDTIDETTDIETETNEPNYRVYYFTQESFLPYNLRYKPRYVNQYNEQNINDQIETYLFKIQKMYAMTEDSIEANNILAECKEGVIDCIKEIRELNRNIIEGTCEPNSQQLEAIKNYIDDLKTTINRLNNCNGDLTKEVNNINNSNGSSLINSVDIVNSRYMKLINHIDTRITYHKSALATLDQIKYILEDTVNGNTISEEELIDIVENSELDESEKQNINNLIDEINEENINYDFDNKERVFDNNIDANDTADMVYDNNTSVSDTNTTPENNIQNNEIIENNDNIVDSNLTDTNNNKFYNEENDIISNNVTTEETANENVDYTEENIDNETINKETGMVENENSYKNIDTYNDNPFSNIDTYKNNNDSSDSYAETNSNTENIDQEYNYDSEASTLEWTDDMATNENDYIVDTNNSYDYNDYANENFDNNFTNENNYVGNNGNYANGNLNDNLYANSVITQNNLDTNNGNGGYYYTADGEIKNIGIDNNNELGNNGNTIETNLNSNNNVNTYGYNTMLDIINQGTVNNGINTL